MIGICFKFQVVKTEISSYAVYVHRMNEVLFNAVNSYWISEGALNHTLFDLLAIL